MGCHHLDNDSGGAECDSVSAVVHLPAKTYQPHGEGQARQRVSFVDSGPHAWEQVPRRQHVYKQDLGGGFWYLGARGTYHGGRIPQ
jgi:hypothetical protein